MKLDGRAGGGPPSDLNSAGGDRGLPAVGGPVDPHVARHHVDEARAGNVRQSEGRPAGLTAGADADDALDLEWRADDATAAGGGIVLDKRRRTRQPERPAVDDKA